jgi:hypothetical protein
MAILCSVMVENDPYLDIIVARLRATNTTIAERTIALAVLQQVRRWLDCETLICTKTGTEIAREIGVHLGNLPPVMALLEQVGAIRREKLGRDKIIALPPESILRHGPMTNRAVSSGRFQPTLVPITAPLTKEDFAIGIENLKGETDQLVKDVKSNTGAVKAKMKSAFANSRQPLRLKEAE